MWERAHWNGAFKELGKYQDAYVRSLKEFGVKPEDYKNKNILEIGTGPFGGFLPYFQSKVKVSVDPMHDVYRDDEIFIGFKDITYVTEEFEKATFDTKFDAVFCKNALDHGDMSFATLKDIAKVMAPGGKFYLMVNLRLPSELNACHDHSLTIEDFRKYAQESGLTVLKEDIWENDKIHGDVYRTLCAVLQK